APEVDVRLGIGVGSGGVVHHHRRILLERHRAVGAARPGGRLTDFAHRHAHAGPRSFDVDLARARQRAASRKGGAGGGGERIGHVSLPYAGSTRAGPRLAGSGSGAPWRIRSPVQGPIARGPIRGTPAVGPEAEATSQAVLAATP